MTIARPTRVLALASAAAVSAIASLAHGQATPNGWTPEWSDEFNGANIDTNRWNVLTRRDSYNNEQQYYTPSAVAVTGGQLEITADNKPLDGKLYTSGLIRTKVQQQFGRWEVRASLPATQGMWPAIWLLAPDSVPWPTGGEIDIMENRGSAPTIVGSAYHYGASVAAHQYVSKDFSYKDNGSPVSFQGSMHTYGVEWDQARIRYLIDNVPSFTVYRTVPVSTTPMDMIINLAVGGDFGGNANGSTVFTQKLAVDYVHSFSRDNSTRALNNASFESKSGSLFQEWDEYSNGDGSNVITDSVVANAHSGNTAVQMYGKFNGVTNTQGLYQEVTAAAGDIWQVGAFAKNRNGDVLAGGNNARIRIEFIDQNGAVINNGQLTLVTASSPTEYREGVIRKVAPTGTKFARAVVEMQQVANAGGAVDFDDASIRRVTASSIAGDVNLDGVKNADDLDALFHSLTAANTYFNYDGNATVDGADVDSLLTSAFNTKRGDANLDQAVNFDDLIVLAQNYNKVGTGHWSIGDFNGDSNVNFDDLISLAQNYNTGTGAAGVWSASFQADWALAQALVPEPTMALTIVAGAVKIAGRRVRRATTTRAS